jgi:hypothetical protein
VTAQALRFDATDDTDLIPQDLFEKWRAHYWVCAFHYPPRDVSPWAWCLSPGEPTPVPNRQMHWRRPTFGEAQARWSLSLRDPKRFVEMRRDYTARYSRPLEAS